MSNTTHHDAADQTNLSPSRAPDGVSENAATIPAVTPAADRRSDSVGQLDNPPPTAPPAQPSRRGFLMNTMVSAASLATATAIAVAPTVVHAVTSADSDAELIKIGEQFDVAVKGVIAASERLDSLYQPVLNAVEANATWPENQNEWLPGHAKQYLEALTVAQRDIGGPPLADADTALDEAYGRTDKLSKVIRTLPARTIGGVAVKARVAALACAHYWRDPIKLIDWEDEQARLLVEATFHAAGIESVESYLGPLTARICGPLRTPLNDALDRHRKADKLFDRLWDQLDVAKAAAAEKHGHRPIELIAWRNYSHIGGGEIERARNGFLRDGEDASIIDQEYLDAKKRYRAIVRVGKNWDKRAGLNLKSKAVDEARAELRAANKALGSVKLRSVADASALLDLVYGNLKMFHATAEDWEMAALRNATQYLNRVTMLGKAAGALAGRRGLQA
jgi:hypothetical protein